MRSIRRRAGCSTVAKKSGSETATRSTGICRRANQTRTVAGIASSIRMLWNSRATISIVARSTGEVAACLSACFRWCSSSSSAGVPTGARMPSARPPRRRRRRATPSCASAIAAFRRGDGGAGACEVTAKSGSWRPTRRLSRPSTASAWSLPRARPAARVIRRVSSPTSLAALGRASPTCWNSDGAARRHAGRRAEAAGRRRSAAAGGRRGSSGG